ncbi:MAG: signal recognition particle protein [Bacteroidales bacterium]|nr:signal recognition particle protein [Bacteroidales bacterium]MDD7608645.1 signal recognition particle protein [Bacteroidales bacterium]MDY5459040.1 signal recognition particle protein [Candidatus Cryptobacteroides sp.]MEE0340331.1 signal recognition particle protein [Bacteroidales bacterium]
MFENLSEKLERSLKNLKGEGKITEINISETLKEVRRALLDADVSYKVAKEFCDNVKKKAIGSNVLTAVKPQQMMVKIVHDELTEFMGSESSSINLKGSPAVVLVAGLNGSGKTTFSGKLALYLKKKGSKVLLAACDTFRPAAIEQLKTLAEGIGINVFSIEGEKDPVKVANAAIAQARIEGYNVVIVDTAGRLAVDEELMQEIRTMHQAVKPSETLFVVDAMTGQDAVLSAKAFNEAIDYDGVVLTKMDGDTRGGAALSVKAVSGKPIKFVSTGEKMEALDVFYPSRVADRILGMGDVVSLVEKAQEQYDEKQAREMKKKIAKGRFNFNDFYDQIQQVRKMGDIKDLAGMIPGMDRAIKDVDIDNDKAFKGTEAIIKSMTPYEREHPECLNGSRRRRIAMGSGTTIADVNKLIKQFENSQKMMKMAMDGSLAARLKGMR